MKHLKMQIIFKSEVEELKHFSIPWKSNNLGHIREFVSVAYLDRSSSAISYIIKEGDTLLGGREVELNLPGQLNTLLSFIDEGFSYAERICKSKGYEEINVTTRGEVSEALTITFGELLNHCHS